MFEMLYSAAFAGGRDRVSKLFVPYMESNGNVAIDLLRSVAQPISPSGELIPTSTPMDLKPDHLASLEEIVDLYAMARIVNEKWLDAGQRKLEEKDMSSLSEDKQWLVRFVLLYLARVADPDHARAREPAGQSGGEDVPM